MISIYGRIGTFKLSIIILYILITIGWSIYNIWTILQLDDILCHLNKLNILRWICINSGFTIYIMLNAIIYLLVYSIDELIVCIRDIYYAINIGILLIFDIIWSIIGLILYFKKCKMIDIYVNMLIWFDMVINFVNLIFLVIFFIWITIYKKNNK